MIQQIPLIKAPADLRLVAAALPGAGLRLRVDSVNWPDSFPLKPDTTVCLAHDAERLYLHFDVNGPSLKAACVNDSEPVWQDSAVEFFCALPDGERYCNFEFNCIGTMLAARRRGRDADVVHFTAQELARVERCSSLPHRQIEEMDGQYSWTLTAAVPFTLLGCKAGEVPASLRCNFYKCADGTRTPHYVSWNPIPTPKPDFHRPEYFGELGIRS